MSASEGSVSDAASAESGSRLLRIVKVIWGPRGVHGLHLLQEFSIPTPPPPAPAESEDLDQE